MTAAMAFPNDSEQGVSICGRSRFVRYYTMARKEGFGMDHHDNHRRNRNTALLLIGSGLFLLIGSRIGFFTIAALACVWFGVQKIRAGEHKMGYALLGSGAVILLHDYFSIVFAAALILLGYFYMRSKRICRDGTYVQKQNLLESVRYNKEPWVLRNMSIWYLFGEINMDLSLALMEDKEVTLILQGIIGDVDIIVPEDMGVFVDASVLFGQIDAAKERESGALNKIVWQSANYETSGQKVKLIISYIVGDIDIKVL